MRSIVFFIAITLSFFTFGCATKQIKSFQPDNVLEAGLVLDQVRKNNKDLKNFKFSGTIDIKNDDGLINARTVMCVRPPSSFRLEALSPAGQPAFRMSGNETNIYIQTEPGGQIHQKDAKGASLEKLAGIEISVADMIELMCGRPALIPEGSVPSLKKDDSGRQTLSVYSPDGTAIQKFILDNNMRIIQAEIFDSSGSPLYKTEFTGKKESGAFYFPSRISVSAGKKLMKISIRQIWTNTDVKEDLFVLTAQPSGVKE